MQLRKQFEHFVFICSLKKSPVMLLMRFALFLPIVHISYIKFANLKLLMDSLREQWLILISTPLYFIIIGIELVLSHLGHRRAYTVKDTLANVYLMLLNSGIDLAFRIV